MPKGASFTWCCIRHLR